jgi:hypothetical protein
MFADPSGPISPMLELSPTEEFSKQHDVAIVRPLLANTHQS